MLCKNQRLKDDVEDLPCVWKEETLNEKQESEIHVMMMMIIMTLPYDLKCE